VTRRKGNGTIRKVVTVLFLSLVVTLNVCSAVSPASADFGDEHRNNHEGNEGEGAVELHQNRLNQ
jgi:hypothetical protein